MDIVTPKNATRVLAENQDEYLNLPIVDAPMKNGANVMLSLWRPTPEELQAINDGACVTLGIVGRQHPPVMIFVDTDGSESKGESELDALKRSAGEFVDAVALYHSIHDGNMIGAPTREALDNLNKKLGRK